MHRVIAQQSVLRRAGLCIAILLGLPVSSLAQRLPANASPIHYDLSVTPDLQKATFSGSERIELEVKTPTRAITLNAAEIEFDTVTLASSGRTQRARVTLDSAKEQATFAVPELVQAGRAEIEVKYRGILNDQLRGLYLSKANNRRYAVTQLEATDARRMFPCFDEPAYKATFTLSATSMSFQSSGGTGTTLDGFRQNGISFAYPSNLAIIVDAG